LNVRRVAETARNERFRVVDHFLTFLALDAEGGLPVFACIGDEVVQPICDQKVLFFTHYSSLIFHLPATGAFMQISKANRRGQCGKAMLLHKAGRAAGGKFDNPRNRAGRLNRRGLRPMTVKPTGSTV
jgi:hypothetical protein